MSPRPVGGAGCRQQAAGHQVEDSTWSVQLVIEETEDGCWELHCLGAPRVRLTHPAMTEVATSLLRCAHQ